MKDASVVDVFSLLAETTVKVFDKKSKDVSMVIRVIDFIPLIKNLHVCQVIDEVKVIDLVINDF